MAETERFEITVDDAAVRGTMHSPKGQKAPAATVLFCRGVTAHGGATDRLFEELTTALNELGVACVDFEPRCASLILEEFESYGALEYLADVVAVYDHLCANRHDTGPRGLLGFDDGAVGAACLAGRSHDVDQLCLLAPSIGESRSTKAAGSDDEAASIRAVDLPRRYLESMGELSPLEALGAFSGSTLIVHGAADRVSVPSTSCRYAEAIRAHGQVAEQELIVQGDHLFTMPETRATCLTRLARFFESLPKTARRRRSA